MIPGHSGSVIETYCEVFLPGTASGLLKHPKKDRVVRVLSGGGFVILDDGKNDPIDKRIQPGDEIILKAGVAYRFATTSDQPLELHVAQESKYTARMEVLEESGATKDVTPEMLLPAERVEYTPPGTPLRKGSKARQQQAVANSKRTPSGQVINHESAGIKQSDGAATATVANNLRPSHGRFDDAGAG